MKPMDLTVVFDADHVPVAMFSAEELDDAESFYPLALSSLCDLGDAEQLLERIRAGSLSVRHIRAVIAPAGSQERFQYVAVPPDHPEGTVVRWLDLGPAGSDEHQDRRTELGESRE